LPADNYTLSVDKLSIAAGQTASATQLTITLQNVDELTHADSGNTVYLLPVITKNDNAVFPDTAYVRVTQKVVNIDPGNGDIAGSPLDRTGWTATATSTENFYSTSSPCGAIDGPYTTAWTSQFGAPLP